MPIITDKTDAYGSAPSGVRSILFKLYAAALLASNNERK